jgi:Glycosyltransferase like family
VLAPSSITFVVAVNNRAVLENNFQASPCLRTPHSHEILIQEGYSSAAKAYNAAIDKSSNDLMVFIHQDVILLEPWLSQLSRALTSLESQDPNWGVIGCGGTARDGRGRGHLYSSGLGVLGEPFDGPLPVRTLDEIVLILRKSSGLRFDDDLPHFHLYGTDICLRAEAAHKRSYVIPAFCVHNTNYGLVLPPEFYECCRHIRALWKEFLPIQTPCIRITKSNAPIYRRRLLELYLRFLRRKDLAATRVDDVRQLIRTFSTNG